MTQRRASSTPVMAFDGVVAGITAAELGEPTMAHQVASRTITGSTLESEAQVTTSNGASAGEAVSYDSLAVSEGSDEEKEDAAAKASEAARRPPRAPKAASEEWRCSELDGEWELCNVTPKTSTWLRNLTIQGDFVMDGSDKMRRLTRRERGGVVLLSGGLLKRQGATLVRWSRCGAVHVYLRADDADAPWRVVQQLPGQRRPSTSTFASAAKWLRHIIAGREAVSAGTFLAAIEHCTSAAPLGFSPPRLVSLDKPTLISRQYGVEEALSATGGEIEQVPLVQGVATTLAHSPRGQLGGTVRA
eukprot:CAMPEP_0176010328 /NCGR_PEP_ID=MMETSP0120_2-20121206/4712_1 /TAXON_ID=160619 /ORGANISM="Kryptoperidinium foliaceum, Strain CCMP 1326" /LENGTH=302 /DNA_ID=CAMNT_0017343157 /DNA_START=20 /DNA_END=926 /DNA_ORIENTATION=+